MGREAVCVRSYYKSTGDYAARKCVGFQRRKMTKMWAKPNRKYHGRYLPTFVDLGDLLLRCLFNFIRKALEYQNSDNLECKFNMLSETLN